MAEDGSTTPPAPIYRAASAPNHAATAGKITFVSLWNPIAARSWLPAHQQDQL